MKFGKYLNEADPGTDWTKIYKQAMKLAKQAQKPAKQAMKVIEDGATKLGINIYVKPQYKQLPSQVRYVYENLQIAEERLDDPDSTP